MLSPLVMCGPQGNKFKNISTLIDILINPLIEK